MTYVLRSLVPIVMALVSVSLSACVAPAQSTEGA